MAFSSADASSELEPKVLLRERSSTFGRFAVSQADEKLEKVRARALFRTNLLRKSLVFPKSRDFRKKLAGSMKSSVNLERETLTMETNASTIRQLREQEQTLGAQITQLEATAEASAPGIREFRRTRLRQLDDQRLALSERIRRMESSTSSAIDAYVLGAALRDANLVAQGTFGA